MNGPEHFIEAEKLMDQARTVAIEYARTCDPQDARLMDELLALAQIHAQLATAAAMAEEPPVPSSPRGRDWRAVFGDLDDRPVHVVHLPGDGKAGGDG